MDKNQKVEFTKDGYKKAVDSLDFLPEDQREAQFIGVIITYMMA